MKLNIPKNLTGEDMVCVCVLHPKQEKLIKLAEELYKQINDKYLDAQLSGRTMSNEEIKLYSEINYLIGYITSLKENNDHQTKQE